jgi:RNA polymerase sigma-70 factor (ECF subfamily)
MGIEGGTTMNSQLSHANQTEVSLGALLVSHLRAGNSSSAPLPPHAVDIDKLTSLLASKADAAQSQWQGIAVSPQRFANYVAERLPANATIDVLVPSLASMRLDELYLCCACAEGQERALLALEREFFPTVKSALVGMDKTGSLTDEVIQLLRQRLFLREPNKAPKIEKYLGQGSLRNWLRASAVRLGIDLIRAGGNTRNACSDDNVMAALPDSKDDPELAHLKRTYGKAFKETFAQVLRKRPARERTILRYYYVDGLSVEQIGAIYSVHKATVSRWLTASRSALGAQTRTLLQERLGVEGEGIKSIMRLIQSQLDMSIRRWLVPEPQVD